MLTERYFCNRVCLRVLGEIAEPLVRCQVLQFHDLQL